MLRHFQYLPLLLLAFFLPLACDDGGTGPGGEDSENLIGPAGGTVTSGALTLEVPAGALDEAVEITVTPLTNASAPEEFLVVDGTGFDLGPDGLTFSAPATLSIRVADEDVPAGVSKSELRLLRLDGEGGRVPGGVSTDGAVVTGTIDHFSSFGAGLESRFSRVACPALSVGSGSGAPLDEVALGRLPADFEPPLLVMATAEDDSTRSYGVVEVDDAGDATMIVPIHPLADPAGGEVRINVSDGTRACAAVDFTIAALPPAPGELAAVVDLLQEVVRAQAEELGSSPEELINTPVDELPSVLIPMALTQSVIDHPENDHALRAIVEGSSSESAEARLDLLDPLLARTGLRGALEGTVAALEAEAAARGAAREELAPIITGLCSPEYVKNAEFLDYCMDRAASAAHQGVGEQRLKTLSTAMFYGGLVPGLGTATAIGGAVVWVVQTEDKRNAALLPSLLTRMELAVDQSEFLEDEAGPGSWTARIYATNQGYDMGKELLEGALQGAGVAGVAGKAQIAGPEIGDMAGWVLTGPVANTLLEGGTIEDFLIEAENYGPVYVNDDAWSESTIEGDAFSKRSHDEYDPEKVGTATLSVRTEDDEFGGQQVEAQEELRVTQILMKVTPADVYLGPDEPQTFSFEVRESEHPDQVKLVDAEALQGTVGALTYIGGQLHTVEYTAPSEPDPSKPDLLVVEHTAKTGARANSTEWRRATATIRFGEVRITPRSACVEPGESETFTAEFQGLGSPTIRWEIESGDGSLSATTGENVQYTAPGEGSGEVTLRAYLEDDPDNDDRVTFSHGVCSGLAVYRALTASVKFPFAPGGACANPDLEETYEWHNIPEDGMLPLIPPPPSAVLIDRTVTGSEDLWQSGAFGKQVDDVCVVAEFDAMSGFDFSYTGSPSGDSVDIDVETYAESECKDMGEEIGLECSTAAAAVGTIVRFDLDVSEATSYDLRLELTCDAFEIEGMPGPTVDITTMQVAPDGSIVPVNATTQPMSLACSGGSTASLDHVMEFVDPAEPGQTDHVMIVVQVPNASPGAIPTISLDPHSGYVRGFITLREQ